jgi:hypothetical protein
LIKKIIVDHRPMAKLRWARHPINVPDAHPIHPNGAIGQSPQTSQSQLVYLLHPPPPTADWPVGPGILFDTVRVSQDFGR